MSKNYTYIKCEDCARRGTPKCRRKGERWSYSVVPGCMVKVEDAGAFLKPKPKQEAKAEAKHERVSESDTPMANIAYTLHEMREAVKNRMTADHEMTADERAVEKFLKDMMADYADIIDRNYRRIGQAVLDFCNAFTLVYPPNDKDCPAILAGAFENFKDEMGIETVDSSAEDRRKRGERGRCGMSDVFWRHVKGREIGAHTIDLITRDVDGFTQWEVCVDCITQFRGAQREAEAKWRSWARSLNAIARKSENLEGI